MAQPKQVFRVVFWITFALCVLIGILASLSSRRPLSVIFMNTIGGVIWGLIVGGLTVLGMKIYAKLRSSNTPDPPND